MIYTVIYLVTIVALVAIDQLIKQWAVASLLPVGSMELLPGIVELRFALNKGMAFSLFSGEQFFLIAVTSVALLAVTYMLFWGSKGKRLEQIAFVLIIGGGVGNLIDRIATGEVVDYINVLFMDFAIFNFADICVCIGAGLFILTILLEEFSSAEKGRDSHEETGTQPKE